jgi:hypothetical protein
MPMLRRICRGSARRFLLSAVLVVAAVATVLVGQGFLLPEDSTTLKTAAARSPIGK